MLKKYTIEEIYKRTNEYHNKICSPTGVDKIVKLQDIFSRDRYNEIINSYPKVNEMSCIIIDGTYHGVGAVDIINDAPDILIVIPETFSSHGSVYSEGPIIIIAKGTGPWVNKIISKSWIKSYRYPRCEMVVSGEE